MSHEDLYREWADAVRGGGPPAGKVVLPAAEPESMVDVDALRRDCASLEAEIVAAADRLRAELSRELTGLGRRIREQAVLGARADFPEAFPPGMPSVVQLARWLAESEDVRARADELRLSARRALDRTAARASTAARADELARDRATMAAEVQSLRDELRRLHQVDPAVFEGMEAVKDDAGFGEHFARLLEDVGLEAGWNLDRKVFAPNRGTRRGGAS